MVNITRHRRSPPSFADLDELFSDGSSFWGERSLFRDPREELDRAWNRYKYWQDRWKRELATMHAFSEISCDLEDKGDKFVLTADLPGMKKDEVKVNISGNDVEILAQHGESKQEKSKALIRRERSQTRYYECISMPQEISGSKATAKMEDGCLTVDLPKKVPTTVESPIELKVQ